VIIPLTVSVSTPISSRVVTGTGSAEATTAAVRSPCANAFSARPSTVTHPVRSCSAARAAVCTRRAMLRAMSAPAPIPASSAPSESSTIVQTARVAVAAFAAAAAAACSTCMARISAIAPTTRSWASNTVPRINATASASCPATASAITLSRSGAKRSRATT
jgi:hypothetical protein